MTYSQKEASVAWLASYSINNKAAVAQTWNRTIIGTDYVKYVNDTARALGIEQFLELRRSTSNNGSGVSLVKGARWNAKTSTRIIATETIPNTSSYTIFLTDSLANAVTTARARLQDDMLVFIALTDTNGEVDDVSGTRVL